MKTAAGSACARTCGPPGPPPTNSADHSEPQHRETRFRKNVLREEIRLAVFLLLARFTPRAAVRADDGTAAAKRAACVDNLLAEAVIFIGSSPPNSHRIAGRAIAARKRRQKPSRVSGANPARGTGRRLFCWAVRAARCSRAGRQLEPFGLSGHAVRVLKHLAEGAAHTAADLGPACTTTPVP